MRFSPLVALLVMASMLLSILVEPQWGHAEGSSEQHVENRARELVPMLEESGKSAGIYDVNVAHVGLEQTDDAWLARYSVLSDVERAHQPFSPYAYFCVELNELGAVMDFRDC